MRFQAPALFLFAAATLAAQMTSRELFYSDVRPGAKAVQSGGTKSPGTTAGTATKPKTNPPPVATKPKDPPPPSDDGSVARAEPPVKAVFQTVANRAPLGLKYSIEKRDAQGKFSQVDSDETFYAKDAIRIIVESNDAGYLYVIAQGSSGKWKVLYPSAEIAGGSNRVDRARKYLIPPGTAFVFDATAGSEKLFIMLSRKEEPDLENLIYSLKGKRPESGAAPQQMIAMNTVQDDVVQKLREVYSRDLVIEKVDDEKTPPPAAVAANPDVAPREKAVYVVNPSGAADTRVVADIELRHQ